MAPDSTTNPIHYTTYVIEWVTVTDNSKIQIAWEKQNSNDNIIYYNVYAPKCSENENTCGRLIEAEVRRHYVLKSETTYLNDLNSL